MLGPNIRTARLRAGMTQNQLARAIETSDRNIQRWESGDNAPRTEQVRRIAEATGTTADVLLNGGSEDDGEAARMAPAAAGLQILDTLIAALQDARATAAARAET